MMFPMEEALLSADRRREDDEDRKMRVHRKGRGSVNSINNNAPFYSFSDWFKLEIMVPLFLIIVGILSLLMNFIHRSNYNLRSHNNHYNGIFIGSDPVDDEDKEEETHEGTGTEVPANDDNGSKNGHEEEDTHQPYAILFPWFVMLIGIIGYYFISRFVRFIPYTAFIFSAGTAMGLLAYRFPGKNAIMDTTQLWLGINGEVILLTFLPGLLFLEAFNINVYLFMQSFWQIMIFAFPMVLAGTALTALVAYYIFPYGWSFDLCMTFGSILAATDPVAVAVLLNELGAPSRLKIHVAGESLLNDGSAVVFYRIFSSRFFYELGVPGLGEQVGWGRGFDLFFRLSLGGACIGIAFGIGLVALLFNFNRRLSKEENVVQVVCTIMTAYLVFFVSEILAGCSGIIAVLFCGLTTKAFGETMLNNPNLTHDFWHVIEFLLNTTLFALGGVVWGGIVSDSTASHSSTKFTFSSIDWAYLCALFCLVTVIRFFLLFAFFPITSRIGIGQNWRECFFMSYGGLRGTIGITLALLLSAETFTYTALVPDEAKRYQYREFADKLFGMVGGIAFLTLVVNAPTSEKLLKVLGLVTPTDARKKVVHNFEQLMKQYILVEYIALLAEERFERVDYGIVREHVSPLEDITLDDVNVATALFTKRNPGQVPNTTNLLRYISPDTDSLSELRPITPPEEPARPHVGERDSVSMINKLQRNSRVTVYDTTRHLDDSMVLEERLIFIDLLRGEYNRQIDDGDLDSRGFIPFSLLQSLEIANDAASRGNPLNDWAAAQTVGDMFSSKGDRVLHVARTIRHCKRQQSDADFHLVQTQILQALSFIKAHEAAQKIFKEKFASVSAQQLTSAEKKVLEESKVQVEEAESVIDEFNTDDVSAVKSHYVCQILLHRCAKFFENLAHHGLMTEKEAGEFLEKFDHGLRKLRISSARKTEIRRFTRTRKEQLEEYIQSSISTSITESV